MRGRAFVKETGTGRDSMRLVSFRRDHFAALRAWVTSEREAVEWAGPDMPYPVTDEALETMLAESLRRPTIRQCWCLERKKEPIAHAQAARGDDRSVARLARIIVAPDRRRTGAARLLLSRVMSELFADPDIRRLELNVFAHNHPAIELYSSLGFRADRSLDQEMRFGSETWTRMQMSRPRFP